jgi:hypothetical protein
MKRLIGLILMATLAVAALPGTATADAYVHFDKIHWTSGGRTSAKASGTSVGKVNYGFPASASTTSPLKPLSAVTTETPIASTLGSTTHKMCSPEAEVAAGYIVPPAPFKARVISVRQMPVPATSNLKATFHRPLRLYRVTFRVLVGNAVLPAGHTYTQFAYVGQPMPSGRWCFVGGGSGP